MLKYVILAVILLLAVILIVLAIHRIIQEKHDNKAILEYNTKMNRLRQERADEARRTKTYYTTYNELEPEERKKQINNKEIADYAKWRFRRDFKRNRPISYK